MSRDATLTSFEFFDAPSPAGSPLDDLYLSTNWSIRTGSAFGPTIAGGNSIATVLDVGSDRYRFTIDGLDIDLEAGETYWLGTNNQFVCNPRIHPLGIFTICDGFASTIVGLAPGNPTGFAGLPGGTGQVNGSGVQNTGGPERAFRLFGDFVDTPSQSPASVSEPTVHALVGIGLLGFGLGCRRRATRHAASPA